MGVVPHLITGPTIMQKPLMIHTQVKFPTARMNFSSDVSGPLVPTGPWKGKFSKSLISQQAFPPIPLYRMNPKQLLRTWATSKYTEYIQSLGGEIVATDWETINFDQRQQVLSHMEDVIAEEANTLDFPQLDMPTVDAQIRKTEEMNHQMSIIKKSREAMLEQPSWLVRNHTGDANGLLYKVGFAAGFETAAAYAEPQLVEPTLDAEKTISSARETPTADASSPTVNVSSPQWIPPRTRLEMVGLIEQGFLERSSEIEELPDTELYAIPRGVTSSVLALGLFSRDKLEDDASGSLRKHLEEQYQELELEAQGRDQFWGPYRELSVGLTTGTRAWLAEDTKQFDVFAIEGLENRRPYRNEGRAIEGIWASRLLSKIKEYADTEGRIVVVPERSYISSDGENLAEFYEALGFKKVEMDGQRHELVYTGQSSWPIIEKHQQIMVDMNLFGDDDM